MLGSSQKSKHAKMFLMKTDKAKIVTDFVISKMSLK
jgi:hypothetical protein